MAFTPPTLASETIAHIGSFSIRNSMVMGWLAMAVLIVGALIFKRKGGKMVPRGFQNFVEALIEGLFNFFNSVTQNREQTKRFFPIVTTIFLFVLISNWMGILPGVGPIGFFGEHEGHEIFIPYFRSAYADVNMTLALAIISVIVTQIYGIMHLGFFHYAGKFFINPLKDFIGSFVGILELVSEFAKMISFSFRLFGNIFAGEVLLVVIGFLAPFIAPLPFYGLEIFVGFVQALVFSILTLVFMKMAATSHDVAHHEGAH
jgi:F-type H+-transporting ATPase subunit a